MGANGNWSLQATMQDYNFGGQAPDQRTLNTQFEMTRHEKAFDWNVGAGDLFQFDVPAGQSKQYALNPLPAVTVTSDYTRLGDRMIFGKIPYQAEVDMGNFQEQPEDITVGRGAFALTLGGTPQQWNSREVSTLTGKFQQSWYSDGSAEYTFGGVADWQYDLGGEWAERVDWQYQAQHGFAPLSMDFNGDEDAVTYQLVRAVTDRERIELSTGYDFYGHFWQDSQFDFEYMANKNTKLTLQGGYDIEDHVAEPVGLIWTHVNGQAFYLSLASEYDPSGQGLTQATGQLNWQINHLWHFTMNAGYSGFDNSFDVLDIQILRDLHCLMGSLTYSKELHQFMLGVSIKAFPSPSQSFGVGPTGQLFQPLAGQYY
jgi:hypothetical protein